MRIHLDSHLARHLITSGLKARSPSLSLYVTLSVDLLHAIGTEVVGRPHSVVRLLGPNKDSQYRAALRLQRMPRLFERAARLAAAGSPECGEKKLGSRKLDGWKHGRKEDMKMIAGP